MLYKNKLDVKLRSTIFFSKFSFFLLYFCFINYLQKEKKVQMQFVIVGGFRVGQIYD